MAGNKTDEEIYRTLIRLFEIYKEESEKGKFYLFSERHILEEGTNLEKLETVLSPEEGLHQLGNLAYLALTGKDGNKDRSIKIDGYPKLEIFFWPVLEELLVAEKSTIENVEEKIRQTKEKLEVENKAVKIRKVDLDEEKAKEFLLGIFEGVEEEIFEKIVRETREYLYPKDLEPETQTKGKDESKEGHDAEEFLDSFFAWLRIENKFDLGDTWSWSSNKDCTLIDMSYSGLQVQPGGFIDEFTTVEYSPGGGYGHGAKDLKKELKGKRILSICDSINKRWYLKIVKKNFWQF